MGKIYQGILGPFSGKVGTVVGSVRKGQGYMRGLATSKKDARTTAQLTQRQKFTMSHLLLKPIVPYLRVGFRGYTGVQTPYNAGTSHAVKECIVGKYPNLGFDPSKLTISSGSLEAVEVYSVSIKNNVASFSWTDNSDGLHAFIHDFAMPMVYNFTKCKAIYSLESVSRVDAKATLNIPASWSKDKLSCYIAFASIETDAVSDCIYIGDVKSDGSVEEGANGIILYKTSSEDTTDNNSPSTPSTPTGDKGSESGSSDSGSQTKPGGKGGTSLE